MKNLKFWGSLDKALIDEICRIKGIRVCDMPHDERLEAIQHYNLASQSAWEISNKGNQNA